MADILRKTLDGTWTNIPEPYKPPVAGADPNTPVEENGQLMQTLPDGRKIAIGTAHNTPGPNQADPIIAGAEQTLHDVQPEADTLAAATPDLAGARSVKQQHPGAYDDLSDAELQAKLDAAGHAGDHGYHPGLNTSPLHASLEGFLSGAAEGATSPSGKAAIGGASALLGPAGVPVAAGAEALAQALGVHYGNENAPASFPEAAGNVGEAAAAPAISAATTAAAPIVARELAKVPKAVTGLGGAAIGGYTGYKRGGIPGAVEGALAGGAMGAAVPRSMQALQKIAGVVAPEAAAAEAGPTAAGYERYGGQTGGADPRSATAEARDFMGKASRYQSPFAPDSSDLLGEDPVMPGRPFRSGATNTASDSPAGDLWRQQAAEMDTSRRPFPEGMTVAPAQRGTSSNPHTVDRLSKPPIVTSKTTFPPFSHEGQNLNGGAPAVGGTGIPGGRSPSATALHQVAAPSTAEKLSAELARRLGLLSDLDVRAAAGRR